MVESEKLTVIRRQRGCAPFYPIGEAPVLEGDCDPQTLPQSLSCNLTKSGINYSEISHSHAEISHSHANMTAGRGA